MALYRTGTASMDAQGVITGTGTKWREPLSLIRTGATIVFLTSPLKLAVISEIVSDTEMKAIQTDGEPVANGNYVILLNDSLTVDGMAQDVAETLRYYQSKETVIEDAIDFFKDFDLKSLQDLVIRVEEAAKKTEADRQATEQFKNQTQQIKDSAVAETNQIKSDTDAIKNQTQQIKDSAVTEITGIKNEALDARDEAENAQFAAEQSKVGADSAKAGAETARDEARQWAQQVQPENLLHKDKNLSDLGDKAAARTNIDIQTFYSMPTQSIAYSPDLTKAMSIANDRWGFFNVSDGSYLPMPIEGGGTGSNTKEGARKNLGLATNQNPTFAGINLEELHGANSGVLVLNNKNASGEIVSFSRLYNEIINGGAKTTIHTSRKGGGTHYFQIDEYGNAGVLNSLKIASYATVGTDTTALGDKSIAIGDAYTGFRWLSNGLAAGVSNGVDVFRWEQNSFVPLKKISSWSPEHEYALYVNGTRRGEASALCAGKVEGGAFSAWRTRGAGMLIESENADAAVSIFKAVQWGADWLTSMDTVRFSSGSTETRMNVRGAFYSFGDNGYASCVQWVSTSDIRLKANLKEIKTAKEKVKSIKGYTYFKRNNLDEDEHSFYSEEAGVIAQDVQTVLPEAVYKISNTEFLGVSYSGVTALLVNAINEMIDDSDKQNETIAKQQEEINTLRNELDELKKLVNSMLSANQ